MGKGYGPKNSQRNNHQQSGEHRFGAALNHIKYDSPHETPLTLKYIVPL